jgi:tripartite-type tricarboxylate transporter receptor subunit TctC
VAKAEPDGYTVVTSSSSMASGLVLHKSLPYVPARDFVPVVLFGTQPNVLVDSAKNGFKTVADLVAAAKEKPGTLRDIVAYPILGGLHHRYARIYFSEGTGSSTRSLSSGPLSE